MASQSICIMGVDPGLSGAIAFYFPSYPKVITAEDAPCVGKRIDAATLAERVRQMAPDLAVIELVAAMPGQGVSSMFRFGQAFGTVIGVVTACGVPVEFVTPGKWKKHFGLDADKENARAKALAAWPDNAGVFSRKKDHGRAEAALIARYAAETFTERFRGTDP